MPDYAFPTPGFDARSRPSGMVAIVASAGGIPALFDLLSGLSPEFPLPVAVAQHLARGHSSLAELLSWRTGLDVRWIRHGEMPRPGAVYLVRPGETATVTPAGFALTRLPPFATAWLSVPDKLLTSIAKCYGQGAVGVVLTGMMPVGLDGLRAIRRSGGLVMAQSARTAAYDDMPAAAIDFAKADIVMSPCGIARALCAMVADETDTQADLPAEAQVRAS